MKKILVTCYAVNPYKGSEDGTAWNMLCQIARHHRVLAITRKNNREAIERYFRETDFPGKENLEFRYFDWPYYLRFWKRKNRGALLYFYLWQMTIVSFIKQQRIDFDLAHNLNFHNDWTPTFLWRLGKPLVWGPVGHHPDYPDEFVRRVYGWRSWLMHRIKYGVKAFFWNCDPFLKMAQKRASKVLAINSEVAKVWSVPADQLVHLPAVGAKLPPLVRAPSDGKFKVLMVGRFVPLKGFDLTIKAFARFYKGLPKKYQSKVQLTLIGKGPWEKTLTAMIEEEGIAEVVEVIAWIDQERLWEIYQGASLFCFPSHEGAGMVVPEALAAGLPILCLDNSGPGEFVDEYCGRKVAYKSYEKTIDELSIWLQEFLVNPRLLLELSVGARNRYAEQFTWEHKGEVLRKVYEEVLNEKNILVVP